MKKQYLALSALLLLLSLGILGCGKEKTSQVDVSEIIIEETIVKDIPVSEVVFEEPVEETSHTLLREQLLDIMKTLSPREQKVLKMRFGLLDGRPRTLEEVGYEFDVTRERIRQIEAKALRKLRHPSRCKRLKDYLD